MPSDILETHCYIIITPTHWQRFIAYDLNYPYTLEIATPFNFIQMRGSGHRLTVFYPHFPFSILSRAHNLGFLTTETSDNGTLFNPVFYNAMELAIDL